MNKGFQGILPPEVEGVTYGNLFIEMGKMEWFTYDSVNYLADGTEINKPLYHLFANIKFWGDRSKGLFLK